ncbi:sirohydrochlorin chelatase [Jonesia quinghaiensis]|uniref:sirohydrochlorin chelatase n=1 Tax=Jonesia quinghaiensis TaxID=262806 RepID=UPI00040B5F53|nr:CbiX/SirB N-terminal domain-containing protein [Jonesia quinghaiensis]
MSTRPILLACSHGTDNPHGQRIIDSLTAQASTMLGDVDVEETYVDVQYPQVDTVILDLPLDRNVIVVPMLLSAGFHVHQDIAAAVASRQQLVAEAGATSWVAFTPTLGPHPLLADLVVDRLVQRGIPRDAPLVFAAAGSSDARASADVEALAELVVQRWSGPLMVAYCSAAQPRVNTVVDKTVGAIANYLLAPGFFDDRLHDIADPLGVPVAAPLGDDPRIAEVIVQRYLAAERAAGHQ